MDRKRQEIDRTNFYMGEMAQRNAQKERPPTAQVITQGCQMNARDSEKLAGMLAGMGYVLLERENGVLADLVIFNTCCVRENAENRLYGNLGSFKEKKRQNPGMKIALCGCMMQQDAVIDKIRTSHPFVDVIFGTHNIYRFPQLLCSIYENSGMIVDIWQDAEEIVEDLPSIREYPHKVGINVMYGCDNFCTYCVVPYVRGRERSRAPEDILGEIERMVADGVIEVMLLGQNVNSYGRGQGTNFAELLQKVSDIDGSGGDSSKTLRRIRFMTSHPKDMSDELIRSLCLPKVCKHLHLPVQSGSSRILQAMNRGYTKEGYLELAEKIRKVVPDISITTDIMVGFPGETEEDFLDTLDVVRKLQFNGAFTFIYSRRQNTPADKMEQVAAEVAKDRFNRLLAEVNDITAKKSAEKYGKILEVVADEVDVNAKTNGKNDADGTRDVLLKGRTDDNYLVHFSASADLLGKTSMVKIVEARTFYLNGELI